MFGKDAPSGKLPHPFVRLQKQDGEISMTRLISRTTAVLLLGLVLASQTSDYTATLPYRASRFVHYLEASRGAHDTQGPLTLWERIVYSYILAAG
jgi:hypothetical protein